MNIFQDIYTSSALSITMENLIIFLHWKLLLSMVEFVYQIVFLLLEVALLEGLPNNHCLVFGQRIVYYVTPHQSYPLVEQQFREKCHYHIWLCIPPFSFKILKVST